MHSTRIKELAPLAASVLLAALVILAIATRDQPALGLRATGRLSSTLPTPTVISAIGDAGVTTPSGWTSLRPPPGFLVSGESLAVAPSDGLTAYACVVALDSDAQPRPGIGPANQIWVSHDAGRTWTRRADPPIEPANQCFVRVDRLDPTIAIVWTRAIPLHGPSTPGPAALRRNPLGPRMPTDLHVAVTFDEGTAWQYATDINALAATSRFATAGGVTVGVQDTGLYQSTNRMNTWKPIPGPAGAEGQTPTDMWMQPETGDVLYETADSNHELHLWSGRAPNWDWTPMGATYFDATVVRGPVAGAPLTICGALYAAGYSASPDASPPQRIFCSADRGATWTAQPMPSLPPVANPSPAGQRGSQWAPSVRLAGIAADGALLLVDHRTAQAILYRLGPGVHGWQQVGLIPGGRSASVHYAPSPSSPGDLWSIPVADDFYTQLDPQDRLATKPYAP